MISPEPPEPTLSELLPLSAFDVAVAAHEALGDSMAFTFPPVLASSHHGGADSAHKAEHSAVCYTVPAQLPAVSSRSVLPPAMSARCSPSRRPHPLVRMKLTGHSALVVGGGEVEEVNSTIATKLPSLIKPSTSVAASAQARKTRSHGKRKELSPPPTPRVRRTRPSKEQVEWSTPPPSKVCA